MTKTPQDSSFVFLHRPCCVRRDSKTPNTCGTILDMSSCTANRTCAWIAANCEAG